MKPRTSGIQVESTVTGRDIEMVVGKDAMTHIMGVLTAPYSDPELAVIREYSTNALDSHIEAGVTQPIEVTTPSALHPVFEVRDYGVGLDTEDIENIYSQYGVSTKRGSDEAVGMLGLGCKSALAYDDQFTLIGFKDGTRTTVVVSRDSKGAGNMKIIEVEPTDEPNGARVIVPAKSDNEMQAKAEQFFSYWESGQVLVNGQEPARFQGYALNDAMTIVNKDSASGPENVMVVMGNVPYATMIEGMNVPGSKRLIVRVDIGDVQFSPSREALQYTDHTKATLTRIAEEYKAACDGAIEREVGAADSPREALLAAEKVCSHTGKAFHGARWRGDDLPVKLTISERFYELRADAYQKAKSEKDRQRDYSALNAATATWVLNFGNLTLTCPMQDKFRRYCEYHEIELDNRCVFVSRAELPYGSLLDGVTTVDWSEVRKWRDPANPNPNAGVKRGSGYRAFTYKGADPRHGKTLADELDGSRPIFYVTTRSPRMTDSTFERMTKFVGPCSLVEVADNRLTKFQRLFPAAKHLEVELKQLAEKWWDSLTADEKKLAAMHACNRHEMMFGHRLITPLVSAREEIDDPELRSAIEFLREYNKEGHAHLREEVSFWRSYLSLEGGNNASNVFRRIEQRYPLLAPGFGVDAPVDHLVMYVNAVYGEQGD